MKLTVDQVIQEFDSLSPEQKKQVSYTIAAKSKATDVFSVPINQSVTERLNAVLKEIYRSSRIKASRESTDAHKQEIVWKNILISLIPNKYVQTYEEIWRLESLLGADTIRNSLREHPLLDVNFIENLFSKSSYCFYINQMSTHLFSDYGDLDESQGGPLKKLTALEALQRFGLSVLEESKEKQYVRLA